MATERIEEGSGGSGAGRSSWESAGPTSDSLPLLRTSVLRNSFVNAKSPSFRQWSSQFAVGSLNERNWSVTPLENNSMICSVKDGDVMICDFWIHTYKILSNTSITKAAASHLDKHHRLLVFLSSDHVSQGPVWRSLYTTWFSAMRWKLTSMRETWKNLWLSIQNSGLPSHCEIMSAADRFGSLATADTPLLFLFSCCFSVNVNGNICCAKQ